jgi:hypothetical protein
MALYLNDGKKLKIALNGNSYILNICTTASIVDFVKLLSSDNFILKDVNDLYLTAKKGGK